MKVFDINGSNHLALAKGLGHFEAERWKKYDHWHAVSDWGRVANIKRKKVIPQYQNGRGYAAVHPPFGRFGMKVHTMILPTFSSRKLYSPNAHESYPFIDQKNGDRMDASLENLRYSNARLNGMNKRNVKGYHALKNKQGELTGRYVAQIRMDKKQLYLGSFSESQAAERYREALADAFEVLEY